MKIRHQLATAGIVAATLGLPALSTIPAQAVTAAAAVSTSDSCQLLTMRPADPTRPSYVSYATQTASKARGLGLSDVVAGDHGSVLVCGRTTTILLNFRYDSVVQSITATSASSTAAGTFTLHIAPIPDGTYYIQAPSAAVAQKARAAGLEVLSTYGPEGVVVSGNPATVYAQFSTDAYVDLITAA